MGGAETCEHAGYIELAALATRALAGDDLDRIEARLHELYRRAGDDHTLAAATAGVLDAARHRLDGEQALRAGEARLAEAQRIGQMGSYDWDIATNTNSWSDELYRIYGTEPQSFNASYERFLEFIHPDDRDAVVAVHRQACANGEPYEMEERIVRIDGVVRILRSWGEVVVDAIGSPIRMRGICQDVTEQRAAEAAMERTLAHLSALIESAPDALLVVSANGSIAQSNAQAERLFGYDRGELLGHAVTDVVAAPIRAGIELVAFHRRGDSFPVEVSIGEVDDAGEPSTIMFVRDIQERKVAAALSMQLRLADVRRRHALEINDNVVQGLAASQYAFESGNVEVAIRALHETLSSARLMMGDLLGSDADVHAGDLRRAKAAPGVFGGEVFKVREHAPLSPAAREELPVAHGDLPIRVVLVDDCADVRMLLRVALASDDKFEVVGEAADGSAGVELATGLMPAVVVIDLAMPVMDGLEAIPILRERLPAVKIVALSGFDRARLEPAALHAGADLYLEKGTALHDIARIIDLMVAREVPAPST